MDEEWEGTLPLAQMEDIEVLKRQYAVFSDEVLEKWLGVITGPHREAMEAVLRERGRLLSSKQAEKEARSI